LKNYIPIYGVNMAFCLTENEKILYFFTKIYYIVYMVKYAEDYEDIIDKQVITDYETKEKNGETKFVDSSDIINMIKKTVV